jgi:ribosome recycling factor
MIVPTMVRETWTDERLDDLANRVDEGFRESREDLRQFRQEVNARFNEAKADVDARFDKVDDGFDRLEAKFDAKFDSLQRLMIGGLLTFVLAFVATQT